MQVGSRTLVLNPESGSGDHADLVHEHCADRGIDVLQTEGDGDAIAGGGLEVGLGGEGVDGDAALFEVLLLLVLGPEEEVVPAEDDADAG